MLLTQREISTVLTRVLQTERRHDRFNWRHKLHNGLSMSSLPHLNHSYSFRYLPAAEAFDSPTPVHIYFIEQAIQPHHALDCGST